MCEEHNAPLKLSGRNVSHLFQNFLKVRKKPVCIFANQTKLIQQMRRKKPDTERSMHA